MQVSLIEGLCLQFGAASLFFTIACDLLNIVCCRPRAYAMKSSMGGDRLGTTPGSSNLPLK